MILLGRSFKNAASPRSPPRAKKDRKSNEKGFQKMQKNNKNGVRKWDQFWKHLGVLSWDALGTMTPGEIPTGCRAGGLGRGRGGAKDPPKRLGKRSLEGTVCSVAKRAQDLHALRHKASADCLYGGSGGFGPWAHGMALGPGPFRGPSKDRQES